MRASVNHSPTSCAKSAASVCCLSACEAVMKLKTKRPDQQNRFWPKLDKKYQNFFSDIDVLVNITLSSWKQSQTRALEFSTWVLLKMGIRVSSVKFSWFALYMYLR